MENNVYICFNLCFIIVWEEERVLAIRVKTLSLLYIFEFMFMITFLFPNALMLGFEYFEETEELQFNEFNLYLLFFVVAYILSACVGCLLAVVLTLIPPVLRTFLPLSGIISVGL